MNDLKEKVKEYLVERGWDDLHPVDIAKSLVIESAELLEIFQWDSTRSKTEMDPERLEKVKKELADVLIYCFDMGVILDLDMEKIVEDKLAKVKEKYPVHLFTKENVLDEDTDKLYLNIKQSYREEGKN
jgi:NTP pyrophosphatase (non-canonical NTP hydrolase)